MVFPRAVLDKTVSPAVSSTVGGSFGCFFFFYPHSGNRWSSFTARIGFYGRDRQVVAGFLCVIVLFCVFCFLLLTLLEARPAPELIGLWSRVKLHGSQSLTASFRPRQERLLQGFSKSKTTPERAVFTPPDTHCGVEDFVLQEPQPKEFLFIDDLFMIFFHISVVGDERSLWSLKQ